MSEDERPPVELNLRIQEIRLMTVAQYEAHLAALLKAAGIEQGEN